MKLLDNKVAIVTGGSRGIGKGIVEIFARHGCSVAFTYLSSSQAANDLAGELSSKYQVKVLAYQSDASDYQSAKQLVNDVVKEFGRIDILVNNAGITRDGFLIRMSEKDWDDVIRVNLKSAFNLTQPCAQQMIRQKSGSIINISSVVGVEGNGSQSNYAASKAGLIGFSKSVAIELGPRNIRCNVVAPGFIETDMTSNLPEDIKKQWINDIPLRRPGTPEDVGNVCLFLASDLSTYVSGQVIPVCGAMMT